MTKVRCTICRQQLPTIKSLKTHYLHGHSKIQIIKHILKSSILQSTPNILKHKIKSKAKRNINNNKTNKAINNFYLDAETLYVDDNIHILCSQNEILIGGEDNSVDLEFTFNEALSESKESLCPLKDSSNIKTTPQKKFKLDEDEEGKENNNNYQYYEPSESPSSENSTVKSSPIIKRRIKRRRDQYRINITKMKNNAKLKSLDEKSGNFYICHCRNNDPNLNMNTNNLRKILTSDTESCSETGQSMFLPIVETKIFCNFCSNGYKTEEELLEHKKLHESYCRICNMFFNTMEELKEHVTYLHILKVYVCYICHEEFTYKRMLKHHLDYHIENDTYETVLDLEDDYRILAVDRFANNSYSTSINSILCYLSESHEIYYYSYKFMKIICDICFHEIFLCDYDHHLKTIHYPYTY